MSDVQSIPRRRPWLRLVAWVVLVAAVLGGQTAWMILLRGEALLTDQRLLTAGWVGGGVAVLLLVALLKTTPRNAIRTSAGTGAVLVTLGAAWLQVAALVLLPPALTEDALRYRADAKIWLLGESPYARTPARLREIAAEDPELELDLLDAATEFEDTHTIYLPVSQLYFVAGTAFEVALSPVLGPPLPTVAVDEEVRWREVVLSVPWYQRLTMLRGLAGVCVVLTCAVLVRMLAEARRSVWWAVAFAWHPLVTIEAAGMGHQDFVGVLLLALVVRRLQRDRAARSGLLLGLAALVKPHVVLLLPWLMRRVAQRGPARRMWRVPVALALAVLIPCAALMPWDGGLAGWWEQFRRYAGGWEANGGYYRGVRALLGELGLDAEAAKQAARYSGMALGLGSVALAWWLRAGVARSAYVAMLALVLFSPVAYPWYLSWALVLVPLIGPKGGLGGLTCLTWAATAGLSYQLWHEPVWRLPGSWLAAEYVPVAVAAAVELATMRRRTPPRAELARRPVP